LGSVENCPIGEEFAENWFSEGEILERKSLLIGEPD